ncbi:hypothetical protein, partial [Candidatus Methanoperedens nitratireducens]|uniref:hypothetical protein n=1 Tax=Candidatus Methanoperedens nitratireducens TaxID=1392998 RepID=UPI00211B9F39
AGVEAEVDIVNVEELVGYKDDGLNEQDAPAGSPEHENDTGFEAPDMSVAVVTVDILLPCTTEPFDGFKDREKLNGTGVTGITSSL